MWKDSFIKYRGLFITTTLFMLFFILYLLLNSTIQKSVVADVRQADVIQFVYQQIKEQNISPQAKKALQTLKTGGEYTLADSVVTLEPLDQYLLPDSAELDPLIAAANANNTASALPLIQVINRLVVAKQQRSIKLFNILQAIAAVLTVLLYFMVVFQLLLRLSKTDDTQIESKRETEGIMSTISEGLFLLDADYEIGIEQSASLKKMFKSEKDLEGNFFDFISHYVTQKNIELAKEYLGLLFGDRVKEALVEELNPLKQVEVNIVRRDGSYECHYFDFSFKRVLIDGKISHLLGSVHDITKQVLLEKELAEAQEAQEAQLNMLKSILHIDGKKLSIFFNTVESTLRKINQTLEVKGKEFSNGEIRMLLTNIAGDMHRLKGDSAALGLHSFEFAAHDFEESIDKIKAESSSITGKELLPLTSQLRVMFNDLENMKALVHKFSDVQVAINQSELEDAKTQVRSADKVSNESTVKPVANEFGDALQQLVNTVAQRNRKQVSLNVNQVNSADMPSSIYERVHSIAVQLVRNSISHGIEDAPIRQRLEKPVPAVLDVNLVHSAKGYLLSVHDDGRGIDEAEIKERAIARGIATPQYIEKMPVKKLVTLLFHPDFSSKDEVDLDSGRGVGLHVVRKLVNEANGKVSVSYEKDRYCQFKVLLPLS